MAKLALLGLCIYVLVQPAWSQQTLTLTLETPQVSSQKAAGDLPAGTAGSNMQTSRSLPSPAADKRASNTQGRVIGRIGVVTTRSASIRASRSHRSRILAECRQGTPLGIVNQADRYYGVLMIDGSTGWIPSGVVRLLDYDLVVLGRQAQTIGQQIVQVAMKYVGVSYSWGGYSWAGLDCSGFVKAVFANFGFNLPRCARDQAQVGSPVPFDQLQPGDRLYFTSKGGDIDHTGIYVGNGYFIHSASSRGGVTFDSLSGSKYARSLVSARR